MKRLEVSPNHLQIDCKTHAPIGEGLLAAQLEIPMLCGGKGMCATCHVKVLDGAENLSAIESREERTLGMLTGRAHNSRLSCQARIMGDVRVQLPDATYVSKVEELDGLIGTRAQRDILHAIDGRLMVKSGQLITKYVLTQLRKSEL